MQQTLLYPSSDPAWIHSCLLGPSDEGQLLHTVLRCKCPPPRSHHLPTWVWHLCRHVYLRHTYLDLSTMVICVVHKHLSCVSLNQVQSTEMTMDSNHGGATPQEEGSSPKLMFKSLDTNRNKSLWFKWRNVSKILFSHCYYGTVSISQIWNILQKIGTPKRNENQKENQKEGRRSAVCI